MPISWLYTSLHRRAVARRCHQARYIEHFEFDLTCDVNRDPYVNKISFPTKVFPSLSNAV